MEDVIPVALRHGWISPGQLIPIRTRRASVLDYSRRNRNFKLIPASGDGILVKQTASESEDQERLGNEAHILKILTRSPRFRSLRRFVPRLVEYREKDSLLVTRLIHPATTFSRYALWNSKLALRLDIARTGARVLGTLHECQSTGVLGIQKVTPFAFTAREIIRREIASDRTLGETGKRLEGLEVWNRLDADVAEWGRHMRLIHLDPRWDNFLLTHGKGPRGFLNVRLIDWEVAGRGDPAWDAGYFTCEHLRAWFWNLKREEKDLDGLSRASDVALSELHGAVRAFWNAYSRSRGFSRHEREECVSQFRRWAPYLMLTLAIEGIPSRSRRPWVLSSAMLAAEAASRDPSKFLREWLGL